MLRSINKKSKKLYYLPGLISLLIFPLIIVPAAITQFPKKQYGLNVLFLSPQWTEYNYEGKTIDKIIPRKYKHFIIRNSDANVMVKNATQRIFELKQTGDTLNGVIVTLSETAKYAHFIKLIDCCESLGIKTFFPYKSKVYIFIPDPSSLNRKAEINTRSISPCGGNFITPSLAEIAKRMDMKEPESEFFTIAKQYWLIGFLYVILIFSHIWYKKTYNSATYR